MKTVQPTKQDLAEAIKCGRDPGYFLRNYVKIQHPRRGLIPFETYPFQDDCLNKFKKHRLNIVLKSRQLGLSTITAGYCAWMALFYKAKDILVLATKLSTAQEFTRKVKIMLDSVPRNILFTGYSYTKTAISFDNGSLITAVPTSEDAGRSNSLSLLIIDEAHWIREFDHIWTGLAPTISTGGSAILLSTPNGVGGQFYKLWTDAENGQNDFNPIKLPWHVHPEHDQAWYDKETRSLSEKKRSQEYLCEFESSGDTFLQAEDMQWLHSLIEEPDRSNTIDRNLWVWDEPRPDHRYIVSADVSRGNSTDFSSVHVIDMDQLTVVAEYMSKVPCDVLADVMMKIGRWYNRALLAPENNSFGWFTACRIRDAKYPRLYYEKARGDLYEYKPSDSDEKPGFSTQTHSRHMALTRLENLIRERRFKVHSSRTFEQLRTFVWRNNKAQALAGANDDLVMSLAIGAALCVGSTSEGNAHDGSFEKACMQATSVARRDAAIVVPTIDDVRMVQQPVYGPNAARTSRSPHVRPGGLLDYSWLLK